MIAEYRRDAEERPTPCLIYIGPETPDLSIIEQDERYFVITNGPEEASLQVEREWLNRLYKPLFVYQPKQHHLELQPNSCSATSAASLNQRESRLPRLSMPDW
jgi:hypothetical protein